MFDIETLSGPTVGRLLRRAGIDPLSPPSRECWQTFLDALRATLTDQARERYLMERTLEMTSDDMTTLHERLQVALANLSQERAAIERLVPAIREVLAEAIEAGGSSLRDYARPDGQLGYFSKRFDVYGREGKPCARDDSGTIRRIEQGGRSTWYCPCCQK